jgi:hypothetical protein
LKILKRDFTTSENYIEMSNCWIETGFYICRHFLTVYSKPAFPTQFRKFKPKCLFWDLLTSLRNRS